jgi:hypothetical protein
MKRDMLYLTAILILMTALMFSLGLTMTHQRDYHRRPEPPVPAQWVQIAPGVQRLNDPVHWTSCYAYRDHFSCVKR